MPLPDRRVTDEHWEGLGRQQKYDQLLVQKAKKRARQDLDLEEWSKQGHFKNASATVEAPLVGHIARESADTLSVRDFVRRYEDTNLPVLIDGCAKDWPAMNGAWEPRRLFQLCRHRRFRCGEDDEGYPVKMKMKYFLRYMRDTTDDSPMYVFDSMYNDDKTPHVILSHYSVPHYFSEDLFSLVGEHRRPPYRWMLLGPKRSGTCVHIDPLATSAWNTLLYGRKRWVLFPPCFTRPEVKGRELVDKAAGEDDEAIDYFTYILPRVKARIAKQIEAHAAGVAGVSGVASNGQAVLWPARAPLAPLTRDDPYGGLVIEFTQYPGETVYVPGGWWHAVMNIDHTIAVTQNYCSTSNFCRVWPATRDGRKGMARKWLGRLRETRPDLAAAADAMNAKVGWDPVALASAHKARKQAKYARRKARAMARAEKKAAERNAKGEQASDAEDSDSSSSSSSSGTSSSGSVTSASSLSSAARKPAHKRPKAPPVRGTIDGYQSSSADEV